MPDPQDILREALRECESYYSEQFNRAGSDADKEGTLRTVAVVKRLRSLLDGRVLVALSREEWAKVVELLPMGDFGHETACTEEEFERADRLETQAVILAAAIRKQLEGSE